MNVAFLLSNKGGSPLIGGLFRGMNQLGHRAREWTPGTGCDLLVVCNQAAHTTDYVYPDFPKDATPLAFVDSAEYGYLTRFPQKEAQFATAFSPGSMSHDTKNSAQQLRLRAFLEGRSFPYFNRELFKRISFPENYHPIDYPLYHLSECRIAPNREQYLARNLDIFSSWGISHPWRMQITSELRGCHRKSEILVIEENGTPRMGQSEYFGRMMAAKLCPSFDGYGSGSFRMMEALVRTVLLMAPLSIVTREPLVDGDTCVLYNVTSEGENFVGTDIREKVAWILADPERAFCIYEHGYHHCMQHYTEKATAQYVLDVVEKHDWSKPTQLEL